MIVTTLNRIKAHQPYASMWGKLLKNLSRVKRFKRLSVTEAGDEPLAFSTILECAGLDAALWCCRVETQYAQEWRLFAVWCARQVQHLITDQRSLNAIDVAERYANGLATDEELETARAGAWDAAWVGAPDAAWAAMRTAAWAAAPDAAWAAMRTAAWAAAPDAAWDAANAAVPDIAWDAQSREFLRVVTETEAIMVVKAKND